MMMVVVVSGGDGDGGSGAEGAARSPGRRREGAEVAGRLLGVRPARPFVLYCWRLIGRLVGMVSVRCQS